MAATTQGPQPITTPIEALGGSSIIIRFYVKPV